MTTNWYNNKWVVTLKVLVISAFYAAIGNWIFTTKAGAPVTPVEVIPAMIAMIVLVVISMFVQSLFEKIPKWPKLPTVLYLTIINTYIGSNISPVQNFIVSNISKVQLMALCTPILAYAGIAIGKDLDDFKKQGVKIVIVAVLTFIGTFIGSAVIAQLVLKATGQI
ncbi:MAG: DUF340 domain-containing protein [Clostridiaceae bacterium]|nr:DUF340 domain-containing protein [Clostridiaceae bacterium]